MISRLSRYYKIKPVNGTANDKISGFSLIELLIALAVSSVVLAAIYSVYTGLTRSYTTQNVAAEMQQVVRAGIDFMVEDMITAGLNPDEAAGVGIAVATSTDIRFSADRNMNGTLDVNNNEEIRYFYNAGTNLLRQCLDPTIGANACEDFIGNVTALTFSYLDEDGVDLGDPVAGADLNDIRSIVISMTVQESAGRAGQISRTYSTRFRCRNLGI